MSYSVLAVAAVVLCGAAWVIAWAAARYRAAHPVQQETTLVPAAPRRSWWAEHRARQARYCTKHILVQARLNGPDRLEWSYGTHRTPGNACDGPEHRRVPAWSWVTRS